MGNLLLDISYTKMHYHVRMGLIKNTHTQKLPIYGANLKGNGLLLHPNY
jgi:hypothetical protein